MRKYKRFEKVTFNKDIEIKGVKIFRNETVRIVGWDSIWGEYKIYLSRGSRLMVVKQHYIDDNTDLYIPLEIGDTVVFGGYTRNFKVIGIERNKILGNTITLSNGRKYGEYEVRRVPQYEKYESVKDLLTKIENNL